MEQLALKSAAWALPWIVQASVVSALVLVTLGAGRRWTPRARHAIVAVGFLSFAVPPFLDIPLLPSLGAALEAASSAAPETSVLALPGTLVAAALLVWAAGVVATLGAVVLQAWYLTGLRRRGCRPPPEAAARCLDEVAARMGIRRPPALLGSRQVAGPCITGVLRPAILLPEALIERLPPEELRLILAHELAHLRQWDLGLNLIRALLCAFWWPHPLCWLLAAHSRKIREEACDDAVLDALKPRPAAYARTLLETAAASPAAGLALVSVGALGSDARALATRLQRVVDPGARRTDRLSRLQVLGAMFLGVMAVNDAGVDVRTVSSGEAVVTFVHLSGHRADHVLQHRLGHHRAGGH